MGLHGGRYGLVNGASTVREWSINDSMQAAEIVASNTAFGKHRVPGVQSWSGSFRAFGIQPPVMPGSSFSFQGYEAPDNDGYGAGETYEGTALVKQFQLMLNYQGGEPVNYQCDFDGHLALSPMSSIAPPLDASVPAVYPIAPALGVEIAPSPGFSSYSALPNIAQATLTVSNALVPYVNSSTVVSDELWTGQKAGVFDWSLQIVQQDVDRTTLNKGDQVAVKLFVDGTHFWLLKYGIVQEFTGIVVNRETGAIIQQTIPILMAGVKNADGSLGTITAPDTTTVVWGTAQS